MLRKTIGLYLFLCSTNILAIPSPQSIVYASGLVIQIIVLIFAGLISAFYWLFKYDKNSIQDKKPRLYVFVLISLLLCSLAYHWNFKREMVEKEKLAAEYRCDPPYHANREAMMIWQDYMFERVLHPYQNYETFKYQLDQSKKGYVIDLRLPIWSNSGRLHFFKDGKVNPNIGTLNIYRSELLRTLQLILAKTREDEDTSLFLIDDRSAFIINYSPEEAKQIIDLLGRFKHAGLFILDGKSTYKVKDDLYTYDPISQTSKKAEINSMPSFWPVVEESFIIDQKSVYFKNADHILSVEELADLIRNPNQDTYFIFPYASFYRASENYQNMVKKWLGHGVIHEKLDTKKIIFLDYADPYIRKKVDFAIDKIGSSPFVCVGIGKFDCAHFGLDFAYQANVVRKVIDQTEANFLGYSAQLPEASAAVGYEFNGKFNRYKRKVEERLRDGFEKIQNKLPWQENINKWFILFLIGILIRPIFFPIFMSELFINYRNSLNEQIRIRLLSSNTKPARGIIENLLSYKQTINWGFVVNFVYYFIIAYLFQEIIPNTQVSINEKAMGAFLLGLVMFFSRFFPIIPTRSNLFVMKEALIAIFVVFIFQSSLVNYWFIPLLCGFTITKICLDNFIWLWQKFKFKNFFELIDSDTAQALHYKTKASRLKYLSVKNPFFKIAKSCVIQCNSSGPDLNVLAPWLTHFATTNQTFVVRSSTLSEDQRESSQAGCFPSYLNVKLGEVKDKILELTSTIRKMGYEQDFEILVQEMIECRVSGVLFTSSHDNQFMQSIEKVDGHPSIVSLNLGKAHTEYLGKLTGQRLTSDNPSMNKNLSMQVHFIGVILEHIFQYPQDIEWAFDPKGVLYCFQSRDITSFSGKGIQEESQKIVRAIAGQSWQVEGLEFDIIRAENESKTKLTSSLFQKIYDDGGAWDQALKLMNCGENPILKNFKPFYFCNYLFVHKLRFSLLSFESILLLLKNYVDLYRSGKKWAKITVGGIEQSRLMIAGWNQSQLPADRDRLEVLMKSRLSEYFEQIMPKIIIPAIVASINSSSRPGKFVNRKDDGTKSFCFLKDLSELKLNDSEGIQRFLIKWGHRHIGEVDFLQPTIAEDQNFIKSFHTENSLNSFNIRVENVVDDFTFLREEARDQLYSLFAHIRKILSVLSVQTKLELIDLCRLSIDDFDHRNVKNKEEESDDIFKQQNMAVIPLQKLELFQGISSLKNINSDYNLKNIYAKCGQHVSSKFSFQGEVINISENMKSFNNVSGKIIFVSNLKPEHIPLFSQAKGCIALNANALSHPVIIAREMGFPILVVDHFEISDNLAGKEIIVEKNGNYIWKN